MKQTIVRLKSEYTQSSLHGSAEAKNEGLAIYIVADWGTNLVS